MSHNCKNCTTPLEGKYCSNCGQSADTHKLNFHYMWHDIQHGLLHFDKGIFFTTKELFSRPGHSIREFLEGKRVKHFKPLSMVIVLASIYAFLLHSLHIDMEADISIRNGNAAPNAAEMGALSITDWMSSHYALTRLISIPFLALGVWLCFLRQSYNFVEHLVVSAFITAQGLVFLLVMLPLEYYCGEEGWFMILSYSIQLLLFLWTYMQLFNHLNVFRVLIQALGAVMLYTLFMVIFGIIAVLIAGFLVFG
ncbi:MAG: DUF3667 domain-containing protein [Fluviicola sp.]